MQSKYGLKETQIQYHLTSNPQSFPNCTCTALWTKNLSVMSAAFNQEEHRIQSTSGAASCSLYMQLKEQLVGKSFEKLFTTTECYFCTGVVDH